ncbi:hypothetical protein H310_12316 [Aphanomyces invadans]|uniref:Protein kinase domain-containing protein n=1 Tax=Aphanomyces invadans TaxID=157072 RepID=A0A024THV1_9STRA|nr:hypothetical protein H310_12316 [Aphanomyces invadans]ETV93740.1 hypothetical protein H310_12316 [Aphanomyces invadans]|eukprot:XP_008877549.1 hypothetical protein H310_12316 [Aphanomyces invadans]
MLKFSSAKKRMSVVVPLSVTRCRIFTKAPLGRIPAAFSAAERNAINANIIDKYTSQAYRTLCLAFRDVDASPDAVKTWPDEDVERDLTYICIVGIEDSVSEEVPELIRQCNEAGIVVRMTTSKPFSTSCGTSCYMAPEIIHRKTHWGQPADVWPL